MSQESTPESAASARPFKYYGKQGEFTLLAPFKPCRGREGVADSADARRRREQPLGRLARCTTCG